MLQISEEKEHNQAWNNFAIHESLSNHQLEQFKLFCLMLTDWNQRMNLTAITTAPDIISYHFQDSLALCHAIGCTKIKTLVDVGSGAGFPGLAIAICNPDMHVFLIEVIQKKIRFLSAVTETLGLKNITIIPFDWHTVLSTLDIRPDIVCARASLKPDVLINMFKAKSPFKHSKLAYWASQTWIASPATKKFFEREFSYTVGNKIRKIIFFKTKSRS